MKKRATSWAMAGVAAVGAGLVYVYPPAGVAVATVASFLAIFSIFMLNVPITRLGGGVAAAAGGAAIFLATDNWALGCAFAVLHWSFIPTEVALRTSRDVVDLLPLVGLLAGLVLVGVAYPFGWYVLAVVPMGLFLASYIPTLLKGRAFYSRALKEAKVQVGKPLPVEVALPGRDGSSNFSLAEHLGQFVLLVFIRGDWCPMCHVMMRIVSKEADNLRKHGVKVAIISPTEGQMEDEQVEQLRLEPGMLYDKDAELAQSLNLIDMNPKDGKPVPMPVTILVDKEGNVRHMSRPDDVTAYTSDDRLLQILEAA